MGENVPGHQQVMGLRPRLFTPPEIFSPDLWTRRWLLLPALPCLALAQQQSHSVVLFCVPQGNAAPDSPRTRLARGSWPGRSAAPSECPHCTVADVVEGSQVCSLTGAEPRTLSPGKAGPEIELQ